MGVWWRRWSVRRRVCALAALVLALGCAVRLPTSASLVAEHPRVRPDALAHLLADYTQRHHAGAWSVEQESSNYTCWRYTVAYECGARCAGRVAVEAHDVLAAGRAPRVSHHLVHVRDTRCQSLPLLPWPTFCEETEWRAQVRGAGAGGSRVEETATTWCSAARVLWGSCAARLRDQLERWHQRLRVAALAS